MAKASKQASTTNGDDTTASATPKKRGRKPKALSAASGSQSASNVDATPKKRGRKPKALSAASGSQSASNVDATPKKRGRKPKALSAASITGTGNSATETPKRRGRKPGSRNLPKQSEVSRSEARPNATGSEIYLKGLDSHYKRSGQKSFVAEHTTKSGPLYKFFLDGIKDLYYAEHKLVDALQKLADNSTTEELKNAFEDHKTMTQRQIKRMVKVFSLIDEKAEGKKCEAIEGIIKEADSIIEETDEGTMTRDAALVIAAQKAEHYEIASYGGLVALALTLGLEEVAGLLHDTLVEEEDTDSNLTFIAERNINFDALEDDED